MQFKLEPIVSLFTENFMSIDRISTENNLSIDYEYILSWFMPRYDAYLEGKGKSEK